MWEDLEHDVGCCFGNGLVAWECQKSSVWCFHFAIFRNFKGCHVSKDAEVADFFESLRQSFNAALNASLKSLGCAEAEQWIEKMHQVWEDLKRMIMKTACCQEPCCFSLSCLENQLHIRFFCPMWGQYYSKPRQLCDAYPRFVIWKLKCML